MSKSFIYNQQAGIDLGRKSWNHLPLCLYLALLPTQDHELIRILEKGFCRDFSIILTECIYILSFQFYLSTHIKKRSLYSLMYIYIIHTSKLVYIHVCTKIVTTIKHVLKAILKTCELRNEKWWCCGWFLSSIYIQWFRPTAINFHLQLWVERVNTNTYCNLYLMRLMRMSLHPFFSKKRSLHSIKLLLWINWKSSYVI